MPQLSPMNWLIVPLILMLLFIYMNSTNISLFKLIKQHKQMKTNIQMKW